MLIALFANIMKDQAQPIILGICDFLKAHQIDLVVEDTLAKQLNIRELSTVAPEEIDFAITLGGDGTILRVFHSHPEIDVPILGINLGSLGFMAEIPIEGIYPALDNLLGGRYQIENRLMMEGMSADNQKYLAINEITIHRTRVPSLIDLALYVDGDYLNTFSADGVIISTPNGSTAYSLSAGGPILTPNLEAFVITPICPHTISNRPVVLMPKKEIQVHYLSERGNIEVSYDGCRYCDLHPGGVFRILPTSRKFRLINMLDYDYFSTLRTKLGWSGKLRK